jgi:protein SCO1/2
MTSLMPQRQQTPDNLDEADLAAELERVRAGASLEGLVDALREDAPMHRGRSTTATGRVRGQILAVFAEVGLPERAIPYVLEELETGTEPYPVAGAARALRGQPPDRHLNELLLGAFRNMSTRDEPVSFETLEPSWPVATSTSALREIVSTVTSIDDPNRTGWDRVLDEQGAMLEPTVREALEQLARDGSPESCCASRAAPRLEPRPDDVSMSLAEISHVEVEDQGGLRQSLGALTLGRPTVLTFFYTRCANPNKCVATIKRLAELQEWLALQNGGDAVRILALTYDPEYDSAPRLRRYAQDLGLDLTPSTTIGRTPQGIEELQLHLALRVGRGGATVNRHAIEVFVFDANGRIVATWERQGWDPTEVGATALGAVCAHPAEIDQ